MTQETLSEGARVLAARDPDLARIQERLGMPPLWGRRPGFSTLVRIILEQQVSLSAARTLFQRVAARLGGMTPRIVVATGESGLRELGLTRQKARYCHALAARIVDGDLDLPRVARLSDDAGRSILLSLPGIGPWSVDIYYLMALRRPDVWPRGDLALAAALQEIKRMRTLPAAETQLALAARWSPWRSIAARFLWAHYLHARGQYAPAQGRAS